MNTVKTIGIEKAIRFLWTSVYAGLVSVSLLPPLRAVLLRFAGAAVGADTVLLQVRFANLYHYGFRKLTIGKRCFLGDDVMLDVRGGIRLGDDVTLSSRVSIVTHINVGYPNHPLQKYYPTREAPVVIGDGSYIGTGAILLPGVRIGNMSIVGAGAVVTRDVAERTVVAGVPARRIKVLR
ncbi:acyltransferase [Patescibacteria group bacterium]|nr:acyltransferase [Patescibacteria group bacterium]